MQLRYRRAAAKVRQGEIHLGDQCLQVFGSAVMVFGDDLVAGAVIADRFAKWHMDIQGQGYPSPHLRAMSALGQSLLILFYGEGLDKAIGSRIGGVAWA